jgi:hypothetical protein
MAVVIGSITSPFGGENPNDNPIGPFYDRFGVSDAGNYPLAF